MPLNAPVVDDSEVVRFDVEVVRFDVDIVWFDVLLLAAAAAAAGVSVPALLLC